MPSKNASIVPLIRPQYVPASELLVSALVQREFTNSRKPAGIKGYRFLGQQQNAAVITVAPSTEEGYKTLAKSLREAGIRTNAEDAELAEAVVNSVMGVPPTRGKSIPASPMTPHLALTQDLAGALNVDNPPDIGQTLEIMYVMGRPAEADSGRTMGDLWLEAAGMRLDGDPLLRAIDAAFGGCPELSGLSRREQARPPEVGHWTGRFPCSPFGWLRDQWDKLMSRQWVEALPPRVWADWGTMVLRSAVGFGYLWESRWYENLGRSLLGDSPIEHLPSGSMEVLLPWPPARLPVGSRNVKTEMRQLVSRGLRVREILQDEVTGDSVEEACQSLEVLRNDQAARARIREAMSVYEIEGSVKNTYEQINYALKQRKSKTDATDYYGFLVEHGSRYGVIAPGTEWFAVVASLSCDKPGGETHVGTIMASLARLGLRPELQEVVRSLESAGLAQGSADADHGVRVRSAF